MSLIQRTACALAHFNGCSSKTNAHSETGQMAVCCQTLTLGALSSRSALSMLFGELFKKFGLFLYTPSYIFISQFWHFNTKGLSYMKITNTSQSCNNKYENLERELHSCNANVYFNRDLSYKITHP